MTCARDAISLFKGVAVMSVDQGDHQAVAVRVGGALVAAVSQHWPASGSFSGQVDGPTLSSGDGAKNAVIGAIAATAHANHALDSALVAAGAEPAMLQQLGHDAAVTVPDQAFGQLERPARP